MANNKNQHFVPRCYLRPFTQGEEGKAIRIFNVDRERMIENAAVKHQCSGSYFYGEDEKLEALLQCMEQSYAGTLRRVHESSYIRLLPNDERTLKWFWLLQYLRTEAASKRAVEMNNQLGELVGAGSSFQLEIRDAVLMAMQAFAKEIEVIDDLKVCLLKNSTGIPFLTSDDPAILTNRWFKSDKRHIGSTFGLRTSGVMAILPLSKKILFVAYDSDVYSIVKSGGIAKIKRQSDIQAFNNLQILNCRANIFPSPNYDSQALSEEFRACKGDRINERHVLQYAVLDNTEGGLKRYRVIEKPEAEEHQEALVHSQTLFPSPKDWPLLLQWRNKGFGMVNGTGVGCIRRARIEEGGPPFEKMHTGY